MQKRKSCEFGHSMIEMLGVLAIAQDQHRQDSPVRKIFSYNGFTLMALTGQTLLHLPQPMQISGLNFGNSPLFRVIACRGQTSAQNPQLIQISSSVEASAICVFCFSASVRRFKAPDGQTCEHLQQLQSQQPPSYSICTVACSLSAFLMIFIGQLCTHKLQLRQRLLNFSALSAPAGKIAFLTLAEAILTSSFPSFTATANRAIAAPPSNSFRRLGLKQTFSAGARP